MPVLEEVMNEIESLMDLRNSLKLRIATGGNQEAMLEWIRTRLYANPEVAFDMDMDLKAAAKQLSDSMSVKQ